MGMRSAKRAIDLGWGSPVAVDGEPILGSGWQLPLVEGVHQVSDGILNFALLCCLQLLGAFAESLGLVVQRGHLGHVFLFPSSGNLSRIHRGPVSLLGKGHTATFQDRGLPSIL
eukprot:GAFH01005631.1.p2 GENE.GAFH01005631.1~~GAFH01005631.1.p2  ORF type:complete len:114 (-),score=15.64 GAFH01005631.1:215-556(-)